MILRLYKVIILVFLPLLSFSQLTGNGGGIGGSGLSGGTKDVTGDCEKICYSLPNSEKKYTGWKCFLNKNATILDSANVIQSTAIEVNCYINKGICVKSKSLYTVIDNTGTSFSDENGIRLYFTDGTTADILQPAQSNPQGWIKELQVWDDLITDVLSSKCGASTIETRFNPPPFTSTDLSNYTPPDGLLVPPSELWGLIPSMAHRYLQITACSTCPAINKAELITVNGVVVEPAQPLTLSFVEGLEKRYDLCKDCGKEGVLYYQNTDQIVPESDYPFCYFDCAETLPTIPESGCLFTLVDLCDDGVVDGNGDLKNITVRYSDCGDGSILSNVYELDTDGALIDYTPIGNITDCDGGEVEEPEPICDVEIMTVEQRYDLITNGGETGDVYTLFSKYDDPHPDATTYGSTFNYIGNVTGGTHPSLGFNITNYRVFAMCSNELPVNDSNGHIWLIGAPDDFTTVQFNRINDDPLCGSGSITCVEIQEVKEQDCNGKESYRYIIESETSDSLITYTVQGELSNTCQGEADCDISTSDVLRCAITATTEASINDYIYTIITTNCNDVITGTKSYNMSTGGGEITDIPETNICADGQLVKTCYVDASPMTFYANQIISTTDGSEILVFYLNESGQSYTPVGGIEEWKACVEPSASVICKDACVQGVKVEILIGVDALGEYVWFRNLATGLYVAEPNFATTCPELSCETEPQTLCADGDYPGINDGEAIILTLQNCNDGSSEITGAALLNNPTVSILPLPTNIVFQSCSFNIETELVGCIVDEDGTEWNVILINGETIAYQNKADNSFGSPVGQVKECESEVTIISSIADKHCIEVEGEVVEAFLFLNSDKSICAKPVGGNNTYQQGEYTLVSCCGEETTETLYESGFTVTRPTDTPVSGWGNQLINNNTPLTGDFELCFTITNMVNNSPQMVGINSDPTTNASYTSIDCALYFRLLSGIYNVYQYQNGTFSGTVFSGNYVGQEICYKRIGGTLTYTIGGVPVGTCNIGTGNVFLDDSHYYAAGTWGNGTITYSDFNLVERGTGATIKSVSECIEPKYSYDNALPICIDTDNDGIGDVKGYRYTTTERNPFAIVEDVFIAIDGTAYNNSDSNNTNDFIQAECPCCGE